MAISDDECREFLEYVHALEAAVVYGVVPEQRPVAAALIGALREKYAPTVSAWLYDWEGDFDDD